MPTLSDLRDVDKMSFKFDLGTPFKPYEQLMGVLPLASKDHIPLAYQVGSPFRDDDTLPDTSAGLDV